MTRIQVDPTTGCWICTLATNGKGYPMVQRRTNGKNRGFVAHRYVYEHLVGPIPSGMDLDHTCHTRDCPSPGPNCPHRRCCNPAHLEPVPHKVNCRRGACGLETGRQGRAKTHCKNGHAYTEENTLITRKGFRRCRTCKLAQQRDSVRAWHERNKEYLKEYRAKNAERRRAQWHEWNEKRKATSSPAP